MGVGRKIGRRWAGKEEEMAQGWNPWSPLDACEAIKTSRSAKTTRSVNGTRGIRKGETNTRNARQMLQERKLEVEKFKRRRKQMLLH